MPRTWPETQRSEVTEVRTPEGTNGQASGGHGHLERQEEGLGGAPGVLFRRYFPSVCRCPPWVYPGGPWGHGARSPHTLLPTPPGVETPRVAWRRVKSPELPTVELCFLCFVCFSQMKECRSEVRPPAPFFPLYGAQVHPNNIYFVSSL